MFFEVYKDAGGRWRWRLKAANGRIVADSAYSYARPGVAEHAADRVLREIRRAKHCPEVRRECE